MDDMSTSWNVYDYPDPPEEKEEKELDWDTYYEEQWEQHRLEEFEEEK
jgi:hypothetical protein